MVQVDRAVVQGVGHEQTVIGAANELKPGSWERLAGDTVDYRNCELYWKKGCVATTTINKVPAPAGVGGAREEDRRDQHEQAYCISVAAYSGEQACLHKSFPVVVVAGCRRLMAATASNPIRVAKTEA
jgi:hypothetical protein